MRYFINGKEFSEEEFYKQFDNAVSTYVPYTSCYPKKEELATRLKEDREVKIPIYKENNILKRFDNYMAIEEELFDIAKIIQENEADPEYYDAVSIAIALWNAGYRKMEQL